MDSFSKFLQNKLDEAVLTHSPYLASYVLVNREELKLFLSQKWPLFNIARSDDHRKFTIPAKCHTAISNLQQSVSNTHAKLMKADAKHQRMDVNDVELMTVFSYGSGVHTCKFYFALAEEQLEIHENAHDIEGSNNLSAPKYKLPTTAILTAALLNGGLITKIKINEMVQKKDELSKFILSPSESNNSAKIWEIASKSDSVNTFLFNTTKFIVDLLDSLKSFKITEFTGIKIEINLDVGSLIKLLRKKIQNKYHLIEYFLILKLLYALVHKKHSATAVRIKTNDKITIDIPKKILKEKVKEELQKSLWNEVKVCLELRVETGRNLKKFTNATLIDVHVDMDKD